MLRAWAAHVLIVLLIAAGCPSQGVFAQSSAKPAEASDDSGKGASATKSSKRSDADVRAALDAAEKALDGGKADQTAQQIQRLLAGGRLEPRAMARALYLRGAAFHKQGKHAQAIADLTSALWLKGGLFDSDRAAATALRSEAYREAGLGDVADVKKAGSSPGAWQTAATADAAVGGQRNSESRRNAEAKDAAAAPKSAPSSLSGFFANLFGGGSASSANASSAQTETLRSPPAKQPSVGEAWSTSVEAKPAANAKHEASIRQETAALPSGEKTAFKAAVVASKAQGRYRVQVAAVRARADAESLAARLSKEHAAALGGRQPEVDETVIGNMGTFYRVRLGPFADATEPGALCTKLRGVGLDCLVMAE